MAIDIERESKNSYRITGFYHSRNGKDYTYHGDYLKNNRLIYVVPKKFGQYSKLMFNKKVIKPLEIGTFSWFYVNDDHVIPCVLIDEALDNLCF